VIDVEGDLIVIREDVFPEAKEVGARWDKARGAWTMPATRQNASLVLDAIPDAPDLRGRLGTSGTPVSDARLFDYQREAAGRLVASKRGQLVVLSPGLGKTAVAVVAAEEVVPPWERIVVVAPASLLPTWEREIRKWGHLAERVYLVNGPMDFEAAADARWIVVSWDKMVSEAGIWGKGWPLWILDESVLVKSHTSKRFTTLKKLRGGIDRMWLLSGNPTTRYVDDLWSQLHLIWPAAFQSYWRFAKRFCLIEETPWGDKVVGTRRGRDAIEENDDLVIVVNQEDVIELPEYLFEVVDVRLGKKQQKAYDTMAADFVAELGSGQEVVAQNEVSRLGKLQQIVSWWDGASAKHDALIDLLQTFEGPHLIWTHWRDGANALHQTLIDLGFNVEHVSGTTSKKQRDLYLEAFKRGALDILILSIGVGKFGHTFTNTKTVHYVDKTWAADDYFQSLRRVRRIGLGHRPVVVTYRAPGTVDELVEMNLEGKLGGISRLTRSDLRELLLGLGKEGR
jgi:SNF2 family DNA or RNA helicase